MKHWIAIVLFASLTPTLARAADEPAAASGPAEEAPAAAAAAPSDAPPVATPPPPPDYVWNGSLSGSLVWLAGNSKSITGAVTTLVGFESGPWTLGLKANGVYGEAKTADAFRYSVTASSAQAELKGGRKFNDFVGLYALGMLGYDRVGKISWRAGGEAGASLTLWKLEEGKLLKHQLLLEAGARYVRESWFQFYPDKTRGTGDLPDADVVFVRVGAQFRYAINARTTFVQTLDLLPDVITPENFNLNATTSLQVNVWGPMGLSTNWVFKYDNLPPPGAEKYDSQLQFGVDITF